MPEPRKPVTRVARKSPFLNEGIRKAHKLLKLRLLKGRKAEITRKNNLIGRQRDKEPQIRIWTMDRHLLGDESSRYNFFRYSTHPFLKHLKPKIKIDISKIIKGLLKRKRKVRVLDVGTGHGNFLADLRHKFRDKVELHAISLGTSIDLQKKLDSRQIDKVYNVSIESFLPKQEYDFITSYYGGLWYTPHPVVSLLKVTHSLSIGGIALIKAGRDVNFKVIKPYLEKRGFEFKWLSPGQFQITRIK
ncbi:MAG: hypothetical protein COT55_01000 [Candidatus Diapherotrites archaeon CG09_land_8_20_14_0_10_32_12]|nr:MAG: hypothetical protein COT55_01000 [Candidatus Diapherotrites archaeon CG09_land_8_20_14_0_10_32_12]